MANATARVPQGKTDYSDTCRDLPLPAPAAKTTFWLGSMIGIIVAGSDKGYAAKLDDTQELLFAGLNVGSRQGSAPSFVSETDHTDGQYSIIVDRPLLFEAVIASASLGDEGKKLYARYDNEVQFSDGTYGNYVGRLFARISSTRVLIAPPWSPFHDMDGSWKSVMAAAATGTTTLTRAACNKIVLLPITAAKSIILPPVADCSPGDKILFIKTTTDLVTPTLDGNASETINGATTLALSQSQYASLELTTDGVEWFAPGGSATSGASGTIPVSYVYGEATPLDNTFFVASRKYRVRSIIVRPLVVGSDAGAVTATVNKAPSGTAIASGTALHSSSADLKGTINTNQTLTLSGTASVLEIAAGDAIGMDCTGTMTAARGVVTVTLEPVP